MNSAFVAHPDEVRYPIGDFGLDPAVTSAKRRSWIRQMDELPRKLTEAMAGLGDAQLETPYREGGWTPKQVVHHLADAHLNGFARFELALTEDTPAIKTYEEALWAETADGRSAPAELSLELLAALHRRWTILLESLSETEFGPRVQPSPTRPDDDRQGDPALRLARPPSHGSHRGVPRATGLVRTGRLAWLRGVKTR